MKYRKLRIAWSVGWGLLAVLLCVLWVRSYSVVDTLYLPLTPKSSLGFASEPRMIAVVFGPGPPYFYGQVPVEFWWTNGVKPPSDIWGGYQNQLNTFFVLWVPRWLLLLVATGCAIIPWRRELHWRFSLRTLLIATTLLAAVLGFVVWAVR